ncbi:MAG: hypothetical protein ACXACX_23130 [Candidatus Hodarchaeales archaeon]
MDYYKDWDSSKAPVMLAYDSFDGFSENIENVDEKKLGYLKKKYW